MEYDLRYDHKKEIEDMDLVEIKREIRCQTALISPLKEAIKRHNYYIHKFRLKLDEAEAEEDKTNIGRYTRLIQERQERIEFIQKFLLIAEGYRFRLEEEKLRLALSQHEIQQARIRRRKKKSHSRKTTPYKRTRAQR